MYTEILLPENAPAEYSDRAVLWNAVEKIEKAKNSQLAREIEIALPVELTQEQNINLVREYVNQHFVEAGMCADICLHDTGGGNPHAHIMLTMRPFEQDGEWGTKQKKEYVLDPQGNKIYDPKKRQYKCKSISATDWNEQTKAEEWRGAWAEICNKYLEQGNHAERIDHRSYERQGIDKIPTIHLGASASAMEKRGIATDRGNINREIKVSNIELRQLKARIKKTKGWLYSQPIKNMPTFISIMKGIADSKNLNSRWQKIADLKTQARVLSFLQNNNITDMAQLAEKVTLMNEKLYEVSDEIKKIDRRLDTLAQHLIQYDNYKQHKKLYETFKSTETKKQDVFYDKHSEQIQLYKNAKQYLTAIINGKAAVPLKAWQKEQTKLNTDRFSICEDYYRLKDEVLAVEKIQNTVEHMIQVASRARTVQKTKDIGL